MLNGSVWCIFAIPGGYGSFQHGGAPPWTPSPPPPSAQATPCWVPHGVADEVKGQLRCVFVFPSVSECLCVWVCKCVRSACACACACACLRGCVCVCYVCVSTCMCVCVCVYVHVSVGCCLQHRSTTRILRGPCPRCLRISVHTHSFQSAQTQESPQGRGSHPTATTDDRF